MTATIATASAANDIRIAVMSAELEIDSTVDVDGSILYGVCTNRNGDVVAEIVRFETDQWAPEGHAPLPLVNAWKVWRGVHVRSYADERDAVAAILRGTTFGW
jgi:hypothetical protein